MKTVNCQSVRRRVPSLLDGALPPGEAAELHSHAESCRACSQLLDRALTGKHALRSLSKLHVSPALTTSLRVLGSREMARRARARNWTAFTANLRQDALLWFNNLMRPLALPFAGGLMAATLVFSMIVSSYPLTVQSLDYDVPIWPKERNSYTEATLKAMTPIEFTGADVTVDLVVNDRGRVLDYRFVGGTQSNNPAVRRTVENILLFSEFNPAMASGQRVSGKVRVSFKRSQVIEVRG